MSWPVGKCVCVCDELRLLKGSRVEVQLSAWGLRGWPVLFGCLAGMKRLCTAVCAYWAVLGCVIGGFIRLFSAVFVCLFYVHYCRFSYLFLSDCVCVFVCL